MQPDTDTPRVPGPNTNIAQTEKMRKNNKKQKHWVGINKTTDRQSKLRDLRETGAKKRACQ